MHFNVGTLAFGALAGARRCVGGASRVALPPSAQERRCNASLRKAIDPPSALADPCSLVVLIVAACADFARSSSRAVACGAVERASNEVDRSSAARADGKIRADGGRSRADGWAVSPSAIISDELGRTCGASVVEVSRARRRAVSAPLTASATSLSTSSEPPATETTAVAAAAATRASLCNSVAAEVSTRRVWRSSTSFTASPMPGRAEGCETTKVSSEATPEDTEAVCKARRCLQRAVLPTSLSCVAVERCRGVRLACHDKRRIRAIM